MDSFTLVKFLCADLKGVKASKNKKKNRRRKDQQKNASSNCSAVSNDASSSNNTIGTHKKESNGFDSLCHNAKICDHVLPNIGEMLQSQDVEDDSFAPEDEFDDADIDDEIDPALKERIDREVEDFARRLNSDWPERMQEILSLGQERRPVPISINGNGSLKIYERVDHGKK
ncbi:SKP1-like protein 21 [Camellia lanceoleosa]|uniref:SKP1-like protein 21 n=1 Tax=Camellia lanceoleosa TaxID=1840588 RepID=A0ACC0IBH4_9ERIC|nr:SKP1-like protein 21 [Camellia lanceoleosa]